MRDPWQCSIGLSPAGYSLELRPFWRVEEISHAGYDLIALSVALDRNSKVVKAEAIAAIVENALPDGAEPVVDAERTRTGRLEELTLWSAETGGTLGGAMPGFDPALCIDALKQTCQLLAAHRALFHPQGQVMLSAMVGVRTTLPSCRTVSGSRAYPRPKRCPPFHARAVPCMQRRRDRSKF